MLLIDRPNPSAAGHIVASQPSASQPKECNRFRKQTQVFHSHRRPIVFDHFSLRKASAAKRYVIRNEAHNSGVVFCFLSEKPTKRNRRRFFVFCFACEIMSFPLFRTGRQSNRHFRFEKHTVSLSIVMHAAWSHGRLAQPPPHQQVHHFRALQKFLLDRTVNYGFQPLAKRVEHMLDYSMRDPAGPPATSQATPKLYADDELIST